MKLPVLKEIHTSELTAECLRSVLLKHQGKTEPKMQTAMYRGNVAGAALALLHQSGFTRPAEVCVALGVKEVEQTAAAENRPITDAASIGEVAGETIKVVGLYSERFGKYFTNCKLIGTEVPIRCTIPVDGKPVDFASHLDLLFRNSFGVLVCDDWKWWDEAPTSAFVSRNLQLAMYAYALRHGQVLIDDEWVEFGEWPICRWIFLPNLKPYARNGPDYNKGDMRSDDKIVRTVPFDETCEVHILDEFYTRVRMWRAGLFPAAPEAVRCLCCDSLKFCRQLSIDKGAPLP